MNAGGDETWWNAAGADGATGAGALSPTAPGGNIGLGVAANSELDAATTGEKTGAAAGCN